MKRKRGKGQLQRFRGVALAEAAIVMTLLCMVTLGALQYGWFFYCLHTVTNAARQGARVEATLGGDGLGTPALQNALFPLLLNAATTKDAGPDPGDATRVRGEVFIPKDAPAVWLLPITFLPVPDCKATVIMAKEG